MSVKSFVEGQLVPRKKKKQEVAAPAPQSPSDFPKSDVDASGRGPEERRQAGQEFISARERALGKGATKREANAIAEGQSKDIGLDKFNPQQREEDLATIQDVQNPDLAERPGEFPNSSLLPTGENLLAGAGVAGAAELPIAARVGIGAAAAGTAPFSVPIAGAVLAGGFITGVFLNMRKNAKESVQIAGSTLSARTNKNLRQHIGDIHLGIDREEAIRDFQAQLDAVDAGYRKLKYQDTIKNQVLGTGAAVKMNDFNNFYAAGGEREILVAEFQRALIDPDEAEGARILNMLAFSEGMGVQ